MNGLYYLHIPRTSGTDIQERIEISIAQSKSTENLLWVGGDEITQHKSKSLFCEPHAISVKAGPCDGLLVSGHLAINPIIEFPGIKAYSIIRHPLERLESVGRHLLQAEHNKHSSIEEFEQYFLGMDLCWYGNSYPGFNSEPNMQSAYLTGTLVSSRVDNFLDREPANVAFNIVGAAKSFEDAISMIKERKISISTLPNRRQTIISMQKHFFDKYNLTITNPTSQIVNKSKNLFKFSEIKKRKIIEENEIDFKLYNLVRDHERKTGTAFS